MANKTEQAVRARVCAVFEIMFLKQNFLCESYYQEHCWVVLPRTIQYISLLKLALLIILLRYLFGSVSSKFDIW